MKNNKSLLIVIIVFIILTVFIFRKSRTEYFTKAESTACGTANCSRLDPVFDPVYNIKEIVKQSILLEDHLAHEKKRCYDCIRKHFLFIIALAEEAVCLANSKINDYPHLKDSCEFYNELFEEWLKNKDQSLKIMEKLRNQRKILMNGYIK